MCPFNDGCYCNVAPDGTYAVSCSVDTNFPVFTASKLPISTIEIAGDFTAIYDNAFYLLSNITNAFVLIIKNDFNNPSSLQIYDNSFVTQKANGIINIDFSFFIPTNVGQMANAKYISTLQVQSANMSTVPDLSSFTGLTTINLIDNVITSIQPSDFNLPATPLQTISMLYNKVKTVDSKFASWLSLSKKNILYLNDNPLNTCDTSVQWMANYAVCMPIQIDLTGVSCQSGGTMIDYLTQFAKC
jgi:hypothetical protein